MSDESGLIDDACSRFRAAWQTGQPPRIEDFLPTESPDMNGGMLRDILVNLVGIDLEWRWKTAGVADQQQTVGSSLSLTPRPRLSDYVARYPLLGPIEQVPCDLICNEYRARRRYGDRPTHAEYLDAFGAFHPDLANRLQAIDDGVVSDLLDPSPESLPGTCSWQPEEPESRQTGDDTTPRQSQPAPEASVGHPARIGRYRIERVLGQGGFGLVYLAYDDQLDRPVAIKVPHAHLIVHPKDAEAYLTEARIVASLDHPSIVPVYDVGGTEQFPCFIVSKFIDGTAFLQGSRSPACRWMKAWSWLGWWPRHYNMLTSKGLSIETSSLATSCSKKPGNRSWWISVWPCENVMLARNRASLVLLPT